MEKLCVENGCLFFISSGMNGSSFDYRWISGINEVAWSTCVASSTKRYSNLKSTTLLLGDCNNVQQS